MSARKRPRQGQRCSGGCGKRCRSASGLCFDCSPRTAKRPERPCKTCGKRTTAQSQVCMSCKTSHAASQEVPDESHALQGGRWVRVGLTTRWVPGQAA